MCQSVVIDSNREFLVFEFFSFLLRGFVVHSFFFYSDVDVAWYRLYSPFYTLLLSLLLFCCCLAGRRPTTTTMTRRQHTSKDDDDNDENDDLFLSSSSECSFPVLGWTIQVTASSASSSPNRKNKNIIMAPPPSQYPQNDTEDDTDDDETALEIRQRAFDLLTRMGGPDPETEDVQEWPVSPQRTSIKKKKVPSVQSSVPPYTSYQQQQQQTTGESSSSSSASYVQHPRHPTHTARTAESSSSTSVGELLVRCVSDACTTASSELLTTLQPGSILSTGYQSIRSVVGGSTTGGSSSSSSSYQPVFSGDFQPVTIPSTSGYGRRSERQQGGGGRGYYSDNPVF